MKTEQMSQWASQFGREYTDRNSLNLRAIDELYQQNYGVTRRKLNEEFLKSVPRSARILEVGCNICNQLSLLSDIGYSRLYGIELQHYALLRARDRVGTGRLVEGSALEIPFSDRSFDLVFTSGVLIHIAPGDLPSVMGEIYRCSRTYVWGFEYYSADPMQVDYRGNDNLLWKMDYSRLYRERFPDLSLCKERRLPYLTNSNQDCMFLLKKIPLA
jgi:pseudaminic acid biosynthesis-associated methylase